MHQQLCYQVVKNIPGKKTTYLISVLAIAIFGSACTLTRESSSEPLVALINQDTKRPWYTSVIIVNKAKLLESFNSAFLVNEAN
jgi:hypothetical protein